MSTPFTYVQSEPGLWTVGHYDPAGKWVAESDHNTRDKAAARVHYLSGGTGRVPAAPKPAGDGGQAFPAPGVWMDENVGAQCVERGELGMTLRDYFAGVALQGMLAGRIPPAAKTSGLNPLGVLVVDPDELAHNSYLIADAMVRQRDKATAPAEEGGAG